MCGRRIKSINLLEPVTSRAAKIGVRSAAPAVVKTVVIMD